MNDEHQIKNIFNFKNENLIELEFLNFSQLNNKPIFDYNVYFLYPTIYTIGKYKVRNNNERKWGYMYFDPNECVKMNKVGFKITLKDNNTFYRFSFMSELKSKVFKDKYALRIRLRSIIFDDNLIKMPFVYKNIKNDKTLKKI